jgi:stearoyl-CoA desaturase (delta-9 desaturase)
MLRGSELYRTESKNQETLAKFGHGTPDDWLERNVYSRLPWQGVGITLVLNVVMFGAIGGTIWAVQMLWIPIWAAGVINGLGHWWGYRNYASRDNSRNVFPLGILIGGEELHNNHHTYPTSAKLSLKWWEFDIGWAYILLLTWCGLAKARKLPPQSKMGALRSHVDLALVQTVITNRYDLMARYAREIKRAMHVELLRAQAGIRSSQGAGSSGQWAALRAARKLITRERETLDAKALAVVDAAAQNSPVIGKLLHMREDLKAVWEQSSASAEQVRLHLQDWCQRAEQSGIAALQNMSLRLRSYQT